MAHGHSEVTSKYTSLPPRDPDASSHTRTQGAAEAGVKGPPGPPGGTQGSSIPRPPWAAPGGVEWGTHCPHCELMARNPARCPQAGSGHPEAAERCGRQPIKDPAPHNWQPQRSVHPEEPPPWPRVRGSQDAPAACPASRVFINAGGLSGGPLSLVSQSHQGVRAPALEVGIHQRPLRFVLGPQAARTGRRGGNGPSLPC